MNRARKLGTHRLLPLVAVVVAAAMLAACATEPESAPRGTPIDVAPDPGWPVLEADTAIVTELPEPFIKLVDLDRLRIGMTKDEVLAIFPDPYEIELRGSDELWQYGFAELIFRGERLRDWFDIN